MKKISHLFLVATGLELVLLIIGIVMQKPDLFKPMAVLLSISVACGLGAIPSLKGYRYTAWIITAVVAGMMYPAAFSHWNIRIRGFHLGEIDLRNKWLMLIIIQMVMF